jgi:2-polyprenyl-3-methyl-5-hydroxy-6-metoxy-1,4-benzoquinol methylase
MKDHASGIRQYFDETATRFDGIYSPEKPWGQKAIDALFRKTVNQRYDLIMADLRPMTGKTVLDVGTGSGRYAVELATRGASVTGVDFASEMIVLAQKAAQERGVQDRCRWLRGDFLKLDNLADRFDVSLAIGFFDYIQDPQPILKRMAQLTSRTMYLSFPKRWTARTAPRKLRLALNGCYVRFYTRREVETLLQGLGRAPVSARVSSVNRDFIVKVSFS